MSSSQPLLFGFTDPVGFTLEAAAVAPSVPACGGDLDLVEAACHRGLLVGANVLLGGDQQMTEVEFIWQPSCRRLAVVTHS